MLYFCVAPFYEKTKQSWKQYRKALKFREELEESGVMYWEYLDLLEFERSISEHLTKQILALTTDTDGIPLATASEIGEGLTFLSLTRNDSHRVRPIYKMLAARGLNPWMDVEDLTPGMPWEETTKLALSRTDVFVLFLSEAALKRDGYVWKELERYLKLITSKAAVARRKVVFAKLDPVDVPKSISKFPVSMSC
jgi:hypothetical protein